MRLKYSTTFASICLLLLSCSELVVNEPESNQNRADFETAWKIADTYYPFFEFKGINWDSLYVAYFPQVLQAKGDEIFFILYDLFQKLKDSHVDIRTEGGFAVPTYLGPRHEDRKGFSSEVIRLYFDKPLKVTGDDKIASGLIDGRIGYVHISTFSEGDWIHDFDEVLYDFKNTKGLIIDIRNNDGGDSRTSDYVFSHFIQEPVVETFFFKDGRKQSWWVQPGGVIQYHERVVILINGASLSASELFAESMRQQSNVIVIGDTSGGGGGAAELFQLPSGKRLRLPVKYFKRSDGEMVEWNGIIPDIVLEQTEVDIRQGRDRQLEFSIELLRKQ